MFSIIQTTGNVKILFKKKLFSMDTTKRMKSDHPPDGTHSPSYFPHPHRPLTGRHSQGCTGCGRVNS